MGKFKPEAFLKGKEVFAAIEKTSGISISEIGPLAFSENGPFTLAVIAALETAQIVGLTDGAISEVTAAKIRAAITQLIAEEGGVNIFGGTVYAKEIRGGDKIVKGTETKTHGPSTSINVEPGAKFGQIAAGHGITQYSESGATGQIAASNNEGGSVQVNVSSDGIDITFG